jgi:hypothetical protein
MADRRDRDSSIQQGQQYQQQERFQQGTGLAGQEKDSWGKEGGQPFQQGDQMKQSKDMRGNMPGQQQGQQQMNQQSNPVHGKGGKEGDIVRSSDKNQQGDQQQRGGNFGGETRGKGKEGEICRSCDNQQGEQRQQQQGQSAGQQQQRGFGGKGFQGKEMPQEDRAKLDESLQKLKQGDTSVLGCLHEKLVSKSCGEDCRRQVAERIKNFDSQGQLFQPLVSSSDQKVREQAIECRRALQELTSN